MCAKPRQSYISGAECTAYQLPLFTHNHHPHALQGGCCIVIQLHPDSFRLIHRCARKYYSYYIQPTTLARSRCAHNKCASQQENAATHPLYRGRYAVQPPSLYRCSKYDYGLDVANASRHHPSITLQCTMCMGMAWHDMTSIYIYIIRYTCNVHRCTAPVI